MIKAILFDLDGVLTLDKTGSQSILRYLSQQTGLSYDTLKRAYVPFNKELLSGKITHQDMWQPFCKAVGMEISGRMLYDSFVHTPMDARMIQLVHELKKHLRIGMVTDNKADRVEAILEYFQLREQFDAVSISAQIGSGKDGEAIFQNALDKLETRPEEAVFIDNSAANLITPQRMGIHTILFDDERRSMQELQQSLAKLIQNQRE